MVTAIVLITRQRITYKVEEKSVKFDFNFNFDFLSFGFSSREDKS